MLRRDVHHPRARVLPVLSGRVEPARARPIDGDDGGTDASHHGQALSGPDGVDVGRQRQMAGEQGVGGEFARREQAGPGDVLLRLGEVGLRRRRGVARSG